jgi:hypothetical protein
MYGFKFDLVGSNYFTHQYVQNIQAAYDEGRRYFDGYKTAGCIENSFVFKIPVFNNMPELPCLMP